MSMIEDVANQLFRLRFFVPQNLKNPIFWTTVLCDLLDREDATSLEFELLDYNNNTGIEYEMLRRALNLSDEKFHECWAGKPQTIELIDAKILLLVGIATGAGMEIRWKSGVILYLFDETLDIFVPDGLIQNVRELMVKNFHLVEIS